MQPTSDGMSSCKYVGVVGHCEHLIVLGGVGGAGSLGSGERICVPRICELIEAFCCGYDATAQETSGH